MVEMNKEDQELAEMFSGEERELHPDTVHVTLGKPQKTTAQVEKTAQKVKDKRTDDWDRCEAVKERTWLDGLKDGSKWVCLFGGLAILLWYWEVSGLMDASVAVPSMCVCTALAGWGAGKNVRCK